MHDAFTKTASVSSVIHRTGTSKVSSKFSPSFGVRHGLIKDPNWPPAQFPEHGSAASRRFRRIATTFDVALRGEQVTVTGDISEGGAMFLLDRRVDTKVIDVIVVGRAARAEVISASKQGNRFAHHCRFLDVTESRPVWEAIASS